MDHSTTPCACHGESGQAAPLHAFGEQRCFALPAAAAERPTHLLESDRKVVEITPAKIERYVAKPHRCRSRFCPQCCVALGLKLRSRLIPVLESKFEALQMWTFTIDPTLFKSQQEAFEYVREHKCISEWVRSMRDRGSRSKGKWSLNSRDFFCVIEWQKQTEMIHFHVLLNTNYIPFEVALSSWDRFRPKDAGPVEPGRPAFGTVHFTKGDFKSKKHAARYACKYLLKNPEHDYPDWVLDMRREVKRFQTSKGFWKLTDDEVAKVEPSTKPATEAEEKPSDGTRTTIRERRAKCASETVILKTEEPAPSSDDPPRYSFIRKIKLPYAETLDYLGIESDHRGPVYVTPYDLMDLGFIAEHRREIAEPSDFGDYGQAVVAGKSQPQAARGNAA